MLAGLALAWFTLTGATAASAAGANAPGSPVNVQATVDGSTITVTWDAPTTGAAVDNYEIDWMQVDVLGSSWNWDFTNAGVTSYSVTNLQPGLYTVQVSANAAGCSTGAECASDSTSISFPVSVAAPFQIELAAQPQGVGAVATDDVITVTWSVPDQSATPAPVGYRIYYGPFSQNGPLDHTDVMAGDGSHDLRLSPGEYQVYVVSYVNGCQLDSDCESGASVVIQITLSAPPPPPSHVYLPPNVTSAVDGDQLTFEWIPAPDSDQVVGYEYELNAPFVDGYFYGVPTFYTGTQGPVSVSAETLSLRFEHVARGTYVFGIRAVYQGGNYSPWSDSIEVEVFTQTATLDPNYRRVYSSQRSYFAPNVSGVHSYFSVLYRIDDQIIKAVRLDGNLDPGITWDEISSCHPDSATVNVDVVYLDVTELAGLASGCVGSIQDIISYEVRRPGYTAFQFLTVPIPTTTATFVMTRPGDPGPVSRNFSAYDGDRLAWPNYYEPGYLDRNTGAVFEGWKDGEYATELTQAAFPSDGRTYYAYWSPNPHPLNPLSVDLGFDDFNTSNPQGPINTVWYAGDAATTNLLTIQVRTAPGIQWTAELYPIDSHLRTIGEQFLSLDGDGTFDLNTFEGCTESANADTCSRIWTLEIITTDSNTGDSKSTYINILRSTFETGLMLTINGPDESFTGETYPNDGPFWFRLDAPEDIWDSVPNGMFIGWCTSSQPVSEDDCYSPETGNWVPVLGDLDLEAHWVTDPTPIGISIGNRAFTSQDWIYDAEDYSYYLTVHLGAQEQISGTIDVRFPLGVEHPAPNEHVWNSLLDWAPTGNDGAVNLTPTCDLPGPCFEVYSISQNWIDFSGRPRESGFNFIVTRDGGQSYTVTQDSGDGSPPTQTQQLIGWYPVPSSDVTKLGYGNFGEWSLSLIDSPLTFQHYYPVLGDETLSLLWLAAPVVAPIPDVALTRGQTFVAQAESDYQWGPDWHLVGDEHFSISPTGVISVSETVPVGTYNILISANNTFESLRIGVTVEVRAPVPAPEPTPPAPTPPAPTPTPEPTPTPAPQPTPTPAPVNPPVVTPPVVNPPVVEPPAPTPVDPPVVVPPAPEQPVVITQPTVDVRPLTQPAVSVSAAKDKLGVLGTVQLMANGGADNSVKEFATVTPDICSVASSGLVTALQAGTCLAAVTSKAGDKYQDLTSAPVSITVLGRGLINTANVTEVNGAIVVSASLLQAYAHKLVQLAVEVPTKNGVARTKLRTVQLDAHATGKFAPFKKAAMPRTLVVRAGGKVLLKLRVG